MYNFKKSLENNTGNKEKSQETWTWIKIILRCISEKSTPLNFPVYLGKQEDWLQFDPVLVRTVRL